MAGWMVMRGVCTRVVGCERQRPPAVSAGTLNESARWHQPYPPLPPPVTHNNNTNWVTCGPVPFPRPTFANASKTLHRPGKSLMDLMLPKAFLQNQLII